MLINFTKMQSLGNDFILIDGCNQSFNPAKLDIKKLSNRRLGIGFDQCLIVEKSIDKTYDFFYRIINADGQAVGQCGNGARCLARFIQQQGLSDNKMLRVATSTTLLTLYLEENNQVTVAFKPPDFNPKNIPINAIDKQIKYALTVDNQNLEFYALNLGNPHAIIVAADVNNTPVTTLGAILSTHAFFPQATNVSFVQIINKNRIKLRVYERGCGETPACGSAAVASAAVGQLYYQLPNTTYVSSPGGDLTVHWPNKQEDIYLTGPADFAYQGSFYI